MADGEEEVTSGGGFQAVVRRGVFKTQAEAKVAAEKKTLHNLNRSIENAEKAIESMKTQVAAIKKPLADSKKRLKYWEGEYAAEKDK